MTKEEYKIMKNRIQEMLDSLDELYIRTNSKLSIGTRVKIKHIKNGVETEEFAYVAAYKLFGNNVVTEYNKEKKDGTMSLSPLGYILEKNIISIEKA